MGEQYILDVQDATEGVVIELDDGYRYLVEPGDSSTASLWYATHKAKVTSDASDPGTFTIRNVSIQTGRKSVKARRIV